MRASCYLLLALAYQIHTQYTYDTYPSHISYGVTNMAMTISIDDELKRDFTNVCKEIGLPPSTAFGIFAKTVVRERAIPFMLSAVSQAERQSNAYDQAVAEGLWQGYRDFEAGNALSREESRSQRLSRAV